MPPSRRHAGTQPTSRGHVVSLPPPIPQNPYQRLLYGELETYGMMLATEPRFRCVSLWKARRERGVLHFHWPQPYYRFQGQPRCLRRPLSWLRLGLFFMRLRWARLLGYSLVWTIHQVYPHEFHERLDRVGALALAHACHALVANDRSTADNARDELGSRIQTIEIIPQGPYIGVYPEGRPRDVVRNELGFSKDAFVFLSFGNIRRYKQLDLLLEGFSSAAIPNSALLIAGVPMDEASERALCVAEAKDDRIKIHLSFVPDERVAELFGACDVAVFARGDGGTSAAIVLALSLGVPVIAADVPAYRELIGAGSAGWLFEAGVAASLREALEIAATSVESVRTDGKFEAVRRVETLSWASSAQSYARIFARSG
jgi:glycosyltransferase involved in cell wall biosynthesis